MYLCVLMTPRIFLFTIGFMVCSVLAKAQVFYRLSEFGIAGGSAHYFGDLNPNIGFKETGYNAGFFYKYNATEYIALKGSMNYAHIGYDDKFSNNPYQQLRNLNFQNNIWEFFFQTEFHFFRYNIGDFDHRFTPYVSVGMGAIRHNPYTFYDGKRYDLRPLGTEGQNYDQYKDRRYNPWAVALPIGIGFKYWWNGGFTVSAELVNRLCTTDYIDDVSTTYVDANLFVDPQPGPYPTAASQLQDRSVEVSTTAFGKPGRQRGVSTTKDQYLMFQLGVSMRLPTYKCPK